MRSGGCAFVGVDPRVRGGASTIFARSSGVMGRSPRARGSRARCVRSGDRHGSIPACAGEPRSSILPATPGRVDPRVRGGADRSSINMTVGVGRSPRARGSRPRGLRRPMAAGSIPACAGEPERRRAHRRVPGVDPRVRGGADDVFACNVAVLGRSPRARGSPRRERSGAPDAGSIPACAGEPDSRRVATESARVDPRVRGGAAHVEARIGSDAGRSPRARGSPAEAYALPWSLGSIPACAGEPASGACTPGCDTVDPRVRGGAVVREVTEREGLGRSPRARGSLEALAQKLVAAGRSPRARGSRTCATPKRPREGSIPACAGEPPTRTSSGRHGRVDPRVRGGAHVPQD